ncbi:MAG: hypothetical protein WKF89_14630 [Chitinophagaceae bacterium]
MYKGLLDLHNLLRWVILVLIIIAIIKAYKGSTSRSIFSKGDKTLGLFLMIASHLILLIGLYQWFAGDWGLKNIQNLGMGAVMKNSIYRYWAVEHITGLSIAIILITIGRGFSKKTISDKTKYKKTFWFYLVALAIILITVPWPFRKGIGRPLLPGMHQTPVKVS